MLDNTLEKVGRLLKSQGVTANAIGDLLFLEYLFEGLN
jgi:hypothetical protein